VFSKTVRKEIYVDNLETELFKYLNQKLTILFGTFRQYYFLSQQGMHLHTRQYLCNTCKAAFKTLGALIGHTKRVHEGWKSPNQKIFICSVCEKRFTKKYHVDRHMLIHTGTVSSCPHFETFL
jgi:uncharacterized Zn-finger protein